MDSNYSLYAVRLIIISGENTNIFPVDVYNVLIDIIQDPSFNKKITNPHSSTFSWFFTSHENDGDFYFFPSIKYRS